jgi:hypothetical protein
MCVHFLRIAHPLLRVTPTSAYRCRPYIRISNSTFASLWKDFTFSLGIGYRARLDVLEGRRKDDDAAHSDHNEQ